MPLLAAWQWAIGAIAAFLVGVAKTGVPGLGILVVPLMVLAAGDARRSAGWLLPLLCAADLFAVAYYRRHAQARRLFELLPGVLAGMGAGFLALRVMDDRRLRPLVGAIVLAMVVLHLWRRRHPAVEAVAERRGRSALFGLVAGFSTMVANAAGPVMNLYLLGKRLPKDEFIAMGAWFFLIINLTKLPAYGANRMIDASSLLYDAAMVPALIAGVLSGRAIFVRLPQRRFESLVLALTVAATVLLFV